MQTKSTEDYLEAIIILRETGAATVTGISRLLEVKKPSVNAAINRLAARGLVTHEKYGPIELTEKGDRIATEVYARHKLLRHFLRDILKVNPETANAEACKVEHCISEESLDKLNSFIRETQWSRS